MVRDLCGDLGFPASSGKPNDPDFEKEAFNRTEELARPFEIMHLGLIELCEFMLSAY